MRLPIPDSGGEAGIGDSCGFTFHFRHASSPLLKKSCVAGFTIRSLLAGSIGGLLGSFFLLGMIVTDILWALYRPSERGHGASTNHPAEG
jgi:hypothetical protein